MFSGIVENCGQVVKRESGGSVLWIETGFEAFEMGESISVNGVCVTVSGIDGKRFRCDLSPETLSVTALGELDAGFRVNLEKSLRMGDRNGGHHVTGHVDETLTLSSKISSGEYLEMVFGGVAEPHRSLVIKKGSIAINGVSLTINEVEEDRLSVMLIPHTLECTQLGDIPLKGRVNVEYDWMLKAVAAQVERYLDHLGEKNRELK